MKAIINFLHPRLLIAVLIFILLPILTDYLHDTDLSQNKRFSLHPLSRSILATLAHPLHCQFFAHELHYSQIEELCKQIHSQQPLITYEIFYLDQVPHLVKKNQITNYNQGIISNGQQTALIDPVNETNLITAVDQFNRSISSANKTTHNATLPAPGSFNLEDTPLSRQILSADVVESPLANLFLIILPTFIGLILTLINGFTQWKK